jgi:hypothetical protein
MDKLQEKFFSDPDWKEVETMIERYMEPLMDMNTIDLTQPAEHIKAEVIGRTLAYNKLADFLNDCGLVQNKIQKVVNPYR